MKFKLTDEQYNTLKWTVSIAMPALGVFLGVLGNTLDWPVDTILTIWTAFTTLLGTLLGVSNYTYNKEGK